MLIPRLRFPNFKEEWETTTLEESTSFKQGIQVNIQNQNNKPFPNSIRFIRIVDYTQKTDDIRYIEEKKSANHVDIHDIVMVRYGATAGFVGHGIKGIIANNMFTITPKETIDKDFLYTILKQEKIYKWLNQSNGSSAMPALNFSSVALLSFSYPKQIEEQKKIARLFALFDKKIELQAKKVEQLKQYKILFKKKILKEISSYTELRTVAELKNGYMFLRKQYDDFGLYNIVTISNVTGNQYIDTNFKNKYSFLPKDIQPHQILKENDILISMTGNVGRVSYNIGKNNLLNQRVGVLKLKDNINRDYLFFILNDPDFENSMIDRGQGAAQLNISKNDIEYYSIPYPDLETQKKIAFKIRQFEKKIELEHKKLLSLQTLKKGLIQKMIV